MPLIPAPRWSYQTLNNMKETEYNKRIFFQSCIMDLKLKVFTYKNFAALLLFKTIQLNSSTSNECTNYLVKKKKKK